VSIRPDDCVNCLYVSGLTVSQRYFVQIRASNAVGLGPLVQATGTPQQIPGSPNLNGASSLSGTQLQVLFSPPSGGSTGIIKYVIQWDDNEDFTHVKGSSPTCTTVGYGSCEISGAAITVQPPFSYLVQYLTVSRKYYVRVAARNSVSLQSIDPSGEISDNTNWSQVLAATTFNQRPSAPVTVTMKASGLTTAQVLITPPTSNGGSDITKYMIEWDAASQFNDQTTYGKKEVNKADLKVLSTTVPGLANVLVYTITGLSTGVSYWVRVSAMNSIGYGPVTITSSSAAPGGKPNSPSLVTLSTAVTSSTTVTSTNITWQAPTGSIANGGSPLTGYMVEWWEEGAVPEVQLITFTSGFFPSPKNGDFSLSFGPSPGVKEVTSRVSYLTNGLNIRSELLNLGYTTGASQNDVFNFLIGDLQVERSLIPGNGYTWTVTFLDDSSTGLNKGDQVSIVATSFSGSSDKETVSVFTVRNGTRDQGTPEIQILSIQAYGPSVAVSDLQGWFRLSFNGSDSTPYLSASSSASDVENALNQLNTLRQVRVERNALNTPYNSMSAAGYAWTITFVGAVGDQPALILDKSLLFTPKTGTVAFVSDGDNSLTALGSKASNAVPGEMPKGYNARVVGADVSSFTINNLVPGSKYYVAVSAINAFGPGPKTVPQGTPYALPPKVLPQPPSDVSISVHPGSSTTLDVSYSPPKSNGGADITSYRIEVDITNEFLTPIYTIVACPTSNQHSVFQISTGGTSGDPIVGGSFGLTLKVNGNTFTTNPIPYDAVAMRSDESGYKTTVKGITTTLTQGSATIVASGACSQLVFVGDRLQFDKQKYSGRVYTVVSVNSPNIVLDKTFDLLTGATATSSIYRYHGGRGTTTLSRIACYPDGNVLCSSARQALAGSVQSKLEMIPEALIKGVRVDRDEPDIYNGVNWRVTFLDDSPVGSLNFALTVTPGSNTIVTASGANPAVIVKKISDGFVNPKCTGAQEVPPDKPLATGQFYFGRVYAINEVGYSLPQITSGSQKPMITPSTPTAVTLSAGTSNTELRVQFSPPASDGGDPVNSYMIEYSTRSDFLNANKTYFNFLTGKAPYARTLTGLKTGVFVYVRVSAANSQGYGKPQLSSPSSLNPYQAADAPTQVMAYATSDSMITVSFFAPENNGGDAISAYRIEWDTNANIGSSQSVKPDKGFVEVDVNAFNSYTIQSLTASRTYYVRVFARNSAGLSLPRLSTPSGVAPGVKVPGRPHTITAVPGAGSGQIAVSWQRPRVPWHNVPCSGTLLTPVDCPPPVGGGLPSSDGGSPITEYVVGFNEHEDFSGLDNGEITTTDTQFLITGLTPGRVYYVRVLARNVMGSGQFCSFTETNCLVVVKTVSATALL